MSREHPDHHDAELVLRVYELRRETVMRESRDAMGQFWPQAYEDVVALTRADHPLNRAYRQVGTYWEMVYGMVKHGIVHPDYFLESNAEGLFLFAKVQPHLERYRQEVNPNAFRNVEWVCTQSPAGQRLFEVIKGRVAKMAAARAAK
jgi:hypothetical protein